MADRQRNMGELRLARPNENGTFELVISAPEFKTMRDVSTYLRTLSVKNPQEYMVVRLVGNATVSPETRTVVSLS